MDIEHELKFLDIQKLQLIQQICDLGGKQLKAQHLLRRCTFDLPNSPRGTFVRVRDEGNRITLAYKSHDKSIVSELEETVESFEKTLELLTHMGLIFASYQENYRESYILEGTLITFDTWPGLQTFLEIESPDERQLTRIVSLLGLDAKQGISGTVEEVYSREGIDISGIREITFQTAPQNENAEK